LSCRPPDRPLSGPMRADHETPREHDLPAGTSHGAHDEHAEMAQAARAAHDSGHDGCPVAHDKHAGHSVAMFRVSPGRQMPRLHGTMPGSLVDAKRTRPPEVRGRRGSVFGAG